MANTNRSTSFLSIKDALAILNIQSVYVGTESLRTAFRKAVFKYHPDRNPAGLEMMKLVNTAYETLKAQDLYKIKNSTPNVHDYGDAINNALNIIINLGLEIELCGAWVWVHGNTRSHKDTLKTAGFFWSHKKLSWYFRSKGYKSHNRGTWSMEKIRDAYVSAKVKEEFKQVAYT
jgi:hypothetical protein